jgi:hypothetical protein
MGSKEVLPKPSKHLRWLSEAKYANLREYLYKRIELTDANVKKVKLILRLLSKNESNYLFDLQTCDKNINELLRDTELTFELYRIKADDILDNRI